MEGLRAACQAQAVRKTQFVGIQITGKLDDLNVAQKAKKKKKEITYLNNQWKVTAREFVGKQIVMNLLSSPYYLQLPKENQSNIQVIEFQQDTHLCRLPSDED